MRFSIFKSVKGKVKGTLCTLALFLEMIRSKVVADIAKAVAEGSSELKSSLPAATWQSYFLDGERKSDKAEPSTLYMLDVDHLPEDPEKVYRERIADRIEELGIRVVHKTVSCHGLRVVANCREEFHSIEENQRWLAEQLGLEYDDVCKDWARASFLVPESYFYYLDVTVFDPDEPTPPLTWETYPATSWHPSKEGTTAGAVDGKHTSRLEGTKADSDDEVEEALEYEGIPYARIIDAYWDVANGSETPTEGSRDTKTFHLAETLGPICNYDRELMAKVIPCYDGFTEQEKMKCIDSAIKYRKGISPDLKKALDMIHRQEEMTDYAQRLPKLPMGVRDSVGAVGPHLAMPAIVGTCPAIGALATGVKLEVHGELKNLNLVSYIAGEFASGKGRIDPVIGAWMAEIKANDLPYLEQEEEWREKKRGAKNKKEQPEEPKLPVRYITLNSTVAKLADRLGNTGGKHAYSFTSEADMVANRLSSEGIMNYSILLRNAYDGSAYEREARSVDATNVHIDHLLWNVTMCGTPDALYRVVRNTMDGLQSRIAVAKMPDNTFAPLEEKPYVLTDVQEAHIHQVAHLLMLMSGNLVLPKLEERGRKWVERVRLESMKNDDRAQARQRMRICVTAQRMTCCLMLCLVAERLIKKHGYAGAEQRLKESPSLLQTMMEKAQTSRLLGVYDVLADSLLENALYYFRDRIEKAYTSSDYGGSSRCYNTINGTIYDRLDVTFTREQLTQQVMLAKGGKATRNSIYQMLKNWKKQGLVEFTDEGKYRKLLSA